MVVCFNLFSGKASAQAIVTADPINDTACVGSVAMFRIAATGATSYKWQVSADAGATWYTPAAGSVYLTPADDTLKVMAVDTVNGHIFRAIAIGATVNDTSATATLFVDANNAGTLTGPDSLCLGSHFAYTSSIAGGTWSNTNHAVDTITAAGVDTTRSVGFDIIIYTVHNSCGIVTTTKNLRVDGPVVPAAITGPSTTCVGGHIILMNTNVLGSHTWTSSAPGVATINNAGVVTGVAYGNTTIMYSFTNACGSASVTRSISVDTVIAAGTISGANAICNGSGTTLTATATGGIWLSGNTAVAVVDRSGDVTGIGQGTSIISYYFSNACGASFATHAVEVAVPAAAIGGNDSVGIDSTILLTNTTPGGTWTSSNITIATIGSASGITVGHDTGTTVISYAVTNACGSSSASVLFHVGPLPFAGAIAGPDSVCMGSTITLVDTTAYGPVAEWRSLYDTIATVSPAGVVTAVLSTEDTTVVDTIYARITTAFGTRIIKKAIYVNKIPATKLVAPASISYGGSYNLIGTPAGGAYTTSNPSMTPLIGYGFFVVLGYGQSIFTYTVNNTCGTKTARDTVELAPVAVANVNTTAEALNVFPNPSNGSVTLNLASGTNESAIVVISNVLGEKVNEVTITSNVNAQVTLNQPAGIYLLSATTESGKKYSTKINIAK